MRVVKGARADAKRHGIDSFFYFDPPFWAKAKFLYSRWFCDMQHKELAEQIAFLREPYLLSYDKADAIAELYERHVAKGAHLVDVELYYSGANRVAGHEYVITNLPRLPAETRMFRTNEERDAARDARQAARAVRSVV